MAFLFSILFFFTAQAQVEDTTYDKPADTEFETPADRSATEFGAPTTQTQTDTAAHFRLAEEMAERLGQSLTLNAEQKNEIIERIVKFQENVADVNMDMREGEADSDAQKDLDAELVSLVDDIEGILDESQRADWIRMKNDWMTEVKTHIHSERDVQKQEQKIE